MASSGRVASDLKAWGSRVYRHARPRYFVLVSRRFGFAGFLVPKVATRSLVAALTGADPDIEGYDKVSIRPGQFRGLRQFAFVRDPWERLASCWANGVRDNVGLARYYPELADADFATFVEVISGWELRICDAHVRLQSRLVPRSVDFVGRFERLESDFAQLIDWLGVPLGELPHRNPSSRATLPDLYTPAIHRRVGALYRADVERFGYGREVGG